MPLHTLKRAIGAVLLAVLFLFTIIISTVDLAAAEEQAAVTLPTMTVFANKKPDGSNRQVSEVAWQEGKDPTIVRERDGTYTAKSTTNSYSIKSLLASLGRPTLNVDLGYAADSVSMTADGNLTLSTLLEAFEYLNDGVTLEMMPSLGDGSQSSKRVMQRRLEVLRKTLERSSQVKLKVMPAKVLSRGSRSSVNLDVWRIQIRRAG